MRQLLLIAVLALLAAPARAQPRPANDQIGLEMRLVPVTSTGTTIGLSLREYANLPTGLDDEAIKRLRDYGLRVVAVPIDQLPQATASLTPIGTIQTEWLGMLYRWVPLVTGPQLEEQYTTVDTGPLELPRGRFRLLARSWVVPDLSTAPDQGRVNARLRVELLPQHQQDRRRRLDHLLDTSPPTLDDDGLLFTRLHAVVDIPDGYALVIVPAPPAADWADLKEPAPPADTLPADSAPTFGPSAEPNAGGPTTPAQRPERPAPDPTPAPFESGPTAPAFRTLGEQLLRREAEVTENIGANKPTYTIHRERSLVVVLIPHVPGRYALIP